MARHNELGLQGEVLAGEYLASKGYQIIERNWCYRKHEVDIIASLGEYIVFVEVKTRSTDLWGNPEEAISDSKMRRLVAVADYYIDIKDISLSVRFDVISIVFYDNTSRIMHIEDAFLAPLN